MLTIEYVIDLQLKMRLNNFLMWLNSKFHLKLLTIFSIYIIKVLTKEFPKQRFKNFSITCLELIFGVFCYSELNYFNWLFCFKCPSSLLSL